MQEAEEQAAQAVKEARAQAQEQAAEAVQEAEAQAQEQAAQAVRQAAEAVRQAKEKLNKLTEMKNLLLQNNNKIRVLESEVNTAIVQVRLFGEQNNALRQELAVVKEQEATQSALVAEQVQIIEDLRTEVRGPVEGILGALVNGVGRLLNKQVVRDTIKQAQEEAERARAQAAAAEAAQRVAEEAAAEAQALVAGLKDDIQNLETRLQQVEYERNQVKEEAEEAKRQLVLLHHVKEEVVKELNQYREQGMASMASMAGMASSMAPGRGGGGMSSEAGQQSWHTTGGGGSLKGPPPSGDPIAGQRPKSWRFNYRMDSSDGKKVRFAGTTADVSGESVGEPWPEYWRIASYIGVNSNDEITSCDPGKPGCNNNEFYNEYIANIWKPILKSEDRRYSGLLGDDGGNDREFQRELRRQLAKQEAEQHITRVKTHGKSS